MAPGSFCALLLGLGCVFSVVSPSWAEVFTPEFESNLDSFVKAVMTCRHIPGLTLSVVKGNETWTKGYGYANIDTGKMVDSRTLFNIGSVTKAFTAALVSMALNATRYDVVS